MDQIFAPWRIEWVERDEDGEGGDGGGGGDDVTDGDGDCPFCALPERGADREHRIVARSERAFVLLNNYPYNPGHAMVIPYRHGGEFDALPAPVLHDQSELTQRTIRALRSAFDPDGFNVGYNLGEASGGSIDDHLHAHVVPRWSGDTNFMPVIGDTKVIVEALEDSYERLHEAFGEQDGARSEGGGEGEGDGAVRFDA